MSQTLDRMSTLDAEFFYAEHRNVPMHIGSVAVFEGPAPTRADLMRLFEAKLPRVPRYVPIGNAVRFSVAILSYVDTMSFGVTADYDAAPDLDTFTEGIRRSLAELGGRAAREGAGS
jgi:hypothetical protein